MHFEQLGKTQILQLSQPDIGFLMKGLSCQHYFQLTYKSKLRSQRRQWTKCKRKSSGADGVNQDCLPLF